MDTFFLGYIAAWSLACLAALVLFLRDPASFAIGRRAYWHFLGEPWKLATFAAGASLITLVAPYTGDPTWDQVDGFFMSVLCFTTSAWVAGTLFNAWHRKAPAAEVYVALGGGELRQGGEAPRGGLCHDHGDDEAEAQVAAQAARS